MYYILVGVPLGYANVKTLTEASCRNCQPDLIEFKPTVMVGVAAVWESVRKGVLSKLKQASPIQQKIFGPHSKLKPLLNILVSLVLICLMLCSKS